MKFRRFETAACGLYLILNSRFLKLFLFLYIIGTKSNPYSPFHILSVLAPFLFNEGLNAHFGVEI